MPPGALHQRVTAALSNWQLDDAERLLAGVERDPSPYVAATPAPDAPEGAPASLGRAWADTLRAELLVRRLRVAGFTLVGEPVSPAGPALDLHAGVAGLIDGSPDDPDADPRAEQASRAALAIALVRSAKAAFDAADDALQRAAGLARHARIELLSRRIDAAMDEAVEAASLLDPELTPSPLLVDTLGTLAGVLADLELMPLALDYQRRALEAAQAVAAGPAAEPDRDVLVAVAATRLGELCAELGEGLLDDGAPESAAPYFAEARALAEQALVQLPPESPGVVAAQVVHGWALVGMGEQVAAVGPLRAAVRQATATADRDRTASAELALGRALRRQGEGRAADEHLVAALTLATEHGLPRVRRAALRELCTLHADLDDAGRALPYLQAYLADELDRVDERRTRWVELFGRRKSLLETERAAGQLRRQAYEDPLTHLPNRRYAEARLDGLLAAGDVPALAVVDVDNFKAINDTAGHPAGDAVLRTVGELLVAGVRDTDEVCRWAGDEFVILLPETTAEQGERALERIRAAVARYPWVDLGLDVPVTISAGIASATRGDDRKTLFAAADGVLYDAKRSGRDRVVRLSALTQTRAADGAAPAPAPGTPAPRTTPDGDAARAVAAVREEAAGFAALLGEPHPPLGRPHPGEPLLVPDATVRRPAEEVGPAVVRAAGRSTEQVLALVRDARRDTPDRPVLVVRAAPSTLVALATEHGSGTTVDGAAEAAAVGPLPRPAGRTAVLRTDGADPVATAEAAFVARVAGTEVVLVEGDPLPEDADCLVVVAGADAAQVSSIAARTDVPVVAVPTSAAHPGGLGGLGALVSMLHPAGSGVVVTAVDDGCSAGIFAARVARRSARTSS
ncbi:MULTISPECIES: diguanylate cyclase domain-containing protein [unclassified Blastococcus]|uniref:diguanylate cyclase domain-containing protein n=1 Tax=unclassified Blastococcus TaxID=2619396 RepID=UPI001EEF84BA|nr:MULTISPECIES: diguanylate cyclase [unclassified Blastococcus]